MKKALMTLTLAALAVSARPALAVPIAIIDSGTDLSHPDLVNKQWTNVNDPDDGVDNDDNGYIDDTHGWNFADGNNQLYEKKLVGKYSSDMPKFFEIQLRAMNGAATDDDKAWMKAKRDDQRFMQELSSFGNFMHGTHVAGIAAKGADAAQIMPLKIIPTPPLPDPVAAPGTPAPAGSPLGRLLAEFTAAIGPEGVHALDTGTASNPQGQPQDGGLTDKIIRGGLKVLAGRQGAGLAPVGKYVNDQKARVANCSFGTSATAVKPLLKGLLQSVLHRVPSDAELADYSGYFVNEIVASMGTTFIGAAPDTLFVVAAGNDGQNNDQVPASPSNVRADNEITVAATWGYSKLATFSNYGVEKVDVAAPGVGILSSIPGNGYLSVSGTSQAAPFVANVAGRVLDENPALKPADVKRIILETVDKKEFLKDKVRTGGVANAERAIFAARLSKAMPVADAIDKSRGHVRNMLSFVPIPEDEASVVALPLPMPIF